MGVNVHRPSRLIGSAVADSPTASDWRHRSICRDEDPELFFAVGTTGPALIQIEEAKAVCRRCPVSKQCLNWALNTGQDFGVWGGMSEDERRVLKRRSSVAAPGVPGMKRCAGPCRQWNVQATSTRKYCDDCAPAERAAHQRAWDRRKR